MPGSSTFRTVLRVGLALSKPPKKVHLDDNKVGLPAEVAEFLGVRVAYVTLGIVADAAFQIARTPPDPDGLGAGVP